MDPKWYHVCWPRLTAKGVEPVVSISWASCLRRDLNNTWIIRNRGVWRHGRKANQRRSYEHGGFLKQAFSKSCERKTLERRSVQALWSAWLSTSKVTGNRQEVRSSRVKSREDLWGLQGWSAPTEVDISDGEQRLIDITSVSTSGIGVWMSEIGTMIGFEIPCDGRSRLKTEVCEVMRAQLHTLARAQSLD